MWKSSLTEIAKAILQSGERPAVRNSYCETIVSKIEKFAAAMDG